MSIYCITGKPGCGKSTFVSYLEKNKHIEVSIITEEITENNKRIGFKTIIKENKKILEYQLAEVDNKNIKYNYKKLGKYIINLDNLKIISNKIKELYDKYDIIIIDEIANMQLLCYDYAETILYILHTYKILNKKIIFCCSISLNNSINDFFKKYIYNFIINETKINNTYYYLSYDKNKNNKNEFKKYPELLNNLINQLS